MRNDFDELSGKVSYEMIVCEDGSTDGTKTVVRRLGRELPIQVYVGEARKGNLAAVKDAVALAEREWIFLSGSNCQLDAVDFRRLVPEMASHATVLGKKSPRRDPYGCSLLSRGLGLLLRLLFHVAYRGLDTGFRLMRREPVQRLAPPIRHFAFCTGELVVRCDMAAYSICEVPVSHHSK